jgi:two-component system invasion response regulator UvrY
MNVLIVDDHAIVREGAMRLLSTIDGVIFKEAGNGVDALSSIAAHRPDVILMDVNLPDCNGINLSKRIMLDHGNINILIFSFYTKPVYIARAFRAGAKGFISKSASPDNLVDAVQHIMRGDTYIECQLADDLANVVNQGRFNEPLSPREKDIVFLLSSGRDFPQVAAELNISYKTVANACTVIKRKLLVERTKDLIGIDLSLHDST